MIDTYTAALIADTERLLESLPESDLLGRASLAGLRDKLLASADPEPATNWLDDWC